MINNQKTKKQTIFDEIGIKVTITNAKSLDMTKEEFDEQMKKNRRSLRALEMGSSEVLRKHTDV